MKTSFLPAALAATLLLVAGCGGRKDASEIGIDDEDALPETFDEDAPSEPDARASVLARLREQGLEPGYDASSGRMVAIGRAMKQVADPAVKSFALVRDRCLEEALHAAKFDILSAVFGSNVEVTEAGEPDGGDVTTDKTVTTVVSVNGTMMGLRMLTMAESWTPKDRVYEVAVAIGWSEKSQAAVKTRLLAESGASLSSEAVQDWLDRKNRASLFGPAAFTDPDGNLRMLGIGMADAETTGAKALAEAMARKFAAFSFPTSIKAGRALVSKLDKDGGSQDLSEEYDEHTEPPPRMFMTVLSTQVDLPLSGRKMAVVVVEAIP